MARQTTIRITMDKYATDFLELVFALLVTVEEADEALVTDEIKEAAADLRAFVDDFGNKFFA